MVRVCLPEKPLVLASRMMLDEIDATSVTGQTVSVSTIVSVTRTVERASAGIVARSEALVGQFVMVAAHDVTVRIAVVNTVKVVSPPTAAVLLAKDRVLLAKAVGPAAALVISEETSEETADDTSRGTGKETSAELTTDEAALRSEGTEDISGATLETTAGAVALSRRKWMWRGCEYAVVRAAKRPRVRVKDFILAVDGSFRWSLSCRLLIRTRLCFSEPTTIGLPIRSEKDQIGTLGNAMLKVVEKSENRLRRGWQTQLLALKENVDKVEKRESKAATLGRLNRQAKRMILGCGRGDVTRRERR